MLDLGVYLERDNGEAGWYIVEYSNPDMSGKEWTEVAHFDNNEFQEAIDYARETANDLDAPSRLIFRKTITTVWTTFEPS